MQKLEIRNGARLAAAAGLGLTLAFGAAPVVAMAEGQPPLVDEGAGVASEVRADVPDASQPVWIGNHGYGSLADAFDAAPTDGTQIEVRLASNVAVDDRLTLKPGTNVVLDLAGQEIAATERIIAQGKLTIRDTSEEATGVINGSVNNLLQVQSSLTMESGSIVTTGLSAVSMSSGTASFTMTGGEISAKANAVKASFGATTITGGVLNGAVSLPNDVPGATPSLTIGAVGTSDAPTINGNIVSQLKNADVNLLGGTIAGVEGMLPDNTQVSSRFLSDISESLPASMNKGCSEHDGVWLVDDTLTEANAGVKVTAVDGTSKLYASLASFKGSSDTLSDGATITLMKDATGSLSFDSPGTYAVDLNGFTLRSEDNPAVAITSSNAAVSIEGGAVVSELDDPKASIVGVYDGSETLTEVSLSLSNVDLTMEGDGNAGIIVQGNNTNNTVTLTGCSLSVPNTVMGIYFPPADSTLNIIDTHISAGTGVGVKGGTVNISGATVIEASGENGAPGGAVEGGGIQETGDAVYVEASYGGRDVRVNIDGGTLTSANSNAVKTYVAESYANVVNVDVTGGTFNAAQGSDAVTLVTEGGAEKNNASIEVSGGAFSSQLDEEYCAEGFKPVATPNADGQYVVAKSEDVVAIGEKKYDSIVEALENAQDGATITLLADVYEDVTIPADKTVTIDLAGHTLTNVSGHTVTVSYGATLTVEDSVGGGSVDNVSHVKAAVWNNGMVTLEGGAYTRSRENGSDPDTSGNNSYYNIVNHGVMTIQDGVTVEQDGHYSSMVENGYTSYNSGKGESGYVEGINHVNPTLTINGGVFDGGLNTIKNDDGSVLTINGGTFRNVTQTAVMNYNEATINGGTFETTGSASALFANTRINDEQDKGVFVITGGTFATGGSLFTMGSGYNDQGDIDISGGTFSFEKGFFVIGSTSDDGWDLNITGGAYASNPSEYLDVECAARIGDGVYTVMEREGLREGTYVVADGAEPLTSADFQPGLIVTFDPETGEVTAKRPVTPPAQTGDAVSVDQAEGGKVSVTPSRADEGDEVTITVTPDEGKEVASVTVTDEDGNKVDVKPGEKAGTWTFEMPDGKVTVSATFRCDGGELCPTHHLSDVEVGAWYHDGADWAVSTGLMAGMADGTFAPSTKLSRAQLAVVLWNRAGNPEASDPDAAAAFVDVDPDGFYAGALAWCVETGAFMGLDDTHFDPAGDMTREQLAVVLWRVAGEPESDRDLSAYPDGDTVSAFADTAMRWAVENGVISGQGDGTLDPQGAIDRAQAAVIFQRLAE